MGVRLAAHDTNWANVFEQMREEYSHLLGGIPHKFTHIGSTALPIMAKPIIDIMLITPDFGAWTDCLDLLADKLRPIYGSSRPPIKVCDPSDGNIVNCIIHIEMKGFSECKLLFKKFLLEHPEYLRNYELLKIKNAKQKLTYFDYSSSKAHFIGECLTQARKTYDTGTINALTTL